MQGNSQNFTQDQRSVDLSRSRSKSRSNGGVILREQMMTIDNSSNNCNSSSNENSMEAYHEVRLELRNIGHNLVSFSCYSFFLNSNVCIYNHPD